MHALRSGSRTNAETPPSSPNLTGLCVMAMSLSFKTAIVAGIEPDEGVAELFPGDIPQYVRRRIIGIGNHARHLGIGIAEAAGVPREGLRLFMAGKAKLRAKTLEKLLAAISTPAADSEDRRESLRL